MNEFVMTRMWEFLYSKCAGCYDNCVYRLCFVISVGGLMNGGKTGV